MATTARDVMAAATSEADFQDTVMGYARMKGWHAYHVHDSRRSAAGFPDLVLVRAGRIVFAELKREGQNPTPAQRDWLDELALAASVDTHVTVHVWRPSNWPEIEQNLR